MAEFQAGTRSFPSIITGSRGPENFNPERVKVHMDDEIARYMPNEYPLVTLTGKIKDKEQTFNSRYDWIESDEYPRRLELTADSLIADTSLSVTAGVDARVALGVILLNLRTREQVYVTSTASGVVNVTRNIDGGGEKDMLTGDQLVFTRRVGEDGADVGVSKTTIDLPRFGFTEICRTPFSFTRRGSKLDLYAGKDPADTRKKAAIEHAKGLEYAMYFGARNSFTGAGGHLVTTMGGLTDTIKTNIWDVSGTGSVSERSFDEMLAEVSRWPGGKGRKTKYLLHDSLWGLEINWWAKDKLQYRVLDDSIGFGANEYNSAGGTKVMLIHSPLLDYDHPGWAFLLELDQLTYMYFADDDTHLLKNRGGNGVDGSTEEFLSDVGLKVKLDASHAILKGLA